VKQVPNGPVVFKKKHSRGTGAATEEKGNNKTIIHEFRRPERAARGGERKKKAGESDGRGSRRGKS